MKYSDIKEGMILERKRPDNTNLSGVKLVKVTSLKVEHYNETIQVLVLKSNERHAYTTNMSASIECFEPINTDNYEIF